MGADGIGRKADAVDWQGCTALHHAVLQAQDPADPIIAALLFQLNADVLRPNRRGLNALEVSALGNPIVFPTVLHMFLENPNVSRAEKQVVLDDLCKTLESAKEHVRNDVVKGKAELSNELLTKQPPIVAGD